MEKKSLYSIGAGVLLILAAVVAFYSGIVQVGGMRFDGNKAIFTFKVFKDEWFMEMYKESMTFAAWANIILLAVAGVLMLAKAFVPDMLPNVVLGGVFAALAAMAVLSLFKTFGSFGHAGGFVGVLRILVYVLMGVLSIAAFGLMAAIALMKDSFGSFFFAPAALVAVNAVIDGFMGLTGLFGALRWSFGSLIIFFIFDMVLVGALFAVGMAINED